MVKSTGTTDTTSTSYMAFINGLEGISETFKGHLCYCTTLDTIENNIFGRIAAPQNPQELYRIPVITAHNHARPFIGLLMIL
jgi:hypothetical protein